MVLEHYILKQLTLQLQFATIILKALQKSKIQNITIKTYPKIILQHNKH